MYRKSGIFWLLVLFLVFVAMGDRFLPKPLSTASLQTRTTINNFFIKSFPQRQPKLNPYERTEKAIREEEKQETGK